MIEVPEFKLAGKKVLVTGHRGMVGSACLRRLRQEDVELLTVGRDRVDLRDQAAVNLYMESTSPDVVIVAAAKVGGILANDTYPAEFLYENLMIEANIIHASYKVGVEKLLFLGSSCIYPRDAVQPIAESALLTGPLEKTNEWYAIAKIAGIKLCQAYRRQYGCDFISAMPCNLYGPNDYFHPERSHVIPALIRRFDEAATQNKPVVTCWGTGRPRREFLYVDDLADACVFLLRFYSGEGHLNVGTGADVSIKDLASLVAKTVGYGGSIDWDLSKPDGTMLKRMDVALLAGMGWKATTALEDGLAKAYQWFVETRKNDLVRS